jgi:hypothetical protein
MEESAPIRTGRRLGYDNVSVVVVIACGLLVVLGLAAIAWWGGIRVEVPTAGIDPTGLPSAGLVTRRYVWYVVVAVVAGLGSGVLLAGAGGRLAMRLLAVTAGDAAQGRLTEADQTVGKITVGGTVGFIIFTGLFFGGASGALYLLVRRWLPQGRPGGVAFGGLLLLLLGTRLEPLRADNPDFEIVGPSWLAVAVFSALVIAHGMLVAALAGRYSRSLPLISRRPRAITGHVPLLLLGPMAPVMVPVAGIGGLTVCLSRLRPVVEAVRSRRFVIGGRILLLVIVVVASPTFIASIRDILGRST